MQESPAGSQAVLDEATEAPGLAHPDSSKGLAAVTANPRRVAL
jgi:hypothetical protein